MDILIFGIALLIALSFFSLVWHLLGGILNKIFGVSSAPSQEELEQQKQQEAHLEALEKQERQAWQARTQRPLYQVKKKPKLPR